MSVAEVTAERWTCDGCDVSVSWLDGHRGPLPDTWVISEEGHFCLKCRRERASEAAIDTSEDTTREARAKLRRTSLIEFEVRRTPDRPNNTIAKACRSSAVAVAAVRKNMESQASGSG